MAIINETPYTDSVDDKIHIFRIHLTVGLSRLARYIFKHFITFSLLFNSVRNFLYKKRR